MIYFTYNDSVNGIYESQVIDVCGFLNKELYTPTRLLAAFPRKLSQTEGLKLLQLNSEATVFSSRLPTRFFRLDRFFLRSYFANFPKTTVISRGVLATQLALDLKRKGIINKVVYDGRGAVHAEFSEYIQPGSRFTDRIRKYEENAVTQSDAQISVSNALLDYWKEAFNYISKSAVVIPTTLSSELGNTSIEEKEKIRIKSSLGFQQSDIVFVFSGGDAPWQSASLLQYFVARHFSKNASCKLLLLGTLSANFGELENRVVRKIVPPLEMHKYLSVGDYGLLLRENSVTNSVSAPTKFAEYLFAGLSVIISPKVGDYSAMVEQNALGIIADGSETLQFIRTTSEERLRSRKFSEQYFFKSSEVNKAAYLKLLELVRCVLLNIE